MFHWFDVIQDARGNGLSQWQIGLVDSTGAVVAIYSDSAGTPIVNVSGIANRAVSDASGNYRFFVDNGTYTLQFYDSAGVFQRSIEDVPMFTNEYDELPDGTDVAPALAFQEAQGVGMYRDPSSSMVFVSGGGNKRMRIKQSKPYVVVGTADSTDDSAILEVFGNNGGILFPRLSTAQRDAIASPTNGLVIYNSTTSKLQVRAGGAWVDLH